MKILVINGPNINFLGIREKGIYGNDNYDTLVDMINKKAEELNVKVEVFQSNHEGAIIDKLQDDKYQPAEKPEYRLQQEKSRTMPLPGSVQAHALCMDKMHPQHMGPEKYQNKYHMPLRSAELH